MGEIIVRSVEAHVRAAIEASRLARRRNDLRGEIALLRAAERLIRSSSSSAAGGGGLELRAMLAAREGDSSTSARAWAELAIRRAQSGDLRGAALASLEGDLLRSATGQTVRPERISWSVEQAGRCEDPATLALALGASSLIHERQHRWISALKYGIALVTLLHGRVSGRLGVWGNLRICVALRYLGLSDLALPYCRRAVAMAQASNSVRRLLDARVSLLDALTVLGHTEEAAAQVRVIQGSLSTGPRDGLYLRFQKVIARYHYLFGSAEDARRAAMAAADGLHAIGLRASVWRARLIALAASSALRDHLCAGELVEALASDPQTPRPARLLAAGLAMDAREVGPEGRQVLLMAATAAHEQDLPCLEWVALELLVRRGLGAAKEGCRRAADHARELLARRRARLTGELQPELRALASLA